MSAALSAPRPYSPSPSFVPRNASSRPASPMPSLPPPHPSLPTNPALASSSSGSTSSSFVPRNSTGSRGTVPSPLLPSTGTGMMRSLSTNSPRSASTPHFASRPSSPVPTFTPRMSGEGRIGSSLKNEVMSVANMPKIPKRSKPPPPEVEEGEVRELTKEEKDAKRKAAKAMRKMLEDLPEPLPERLPPKFLPTPAPTPSPPSTGSFKSYAISQASPISSSSSTGKKRPLPEDSPIGLGLGLSMESGKRSKTSISPHRPLSKPLSPELPRTLSSSAIPLRAVTPSASYSPRIRPTSPRSPRETKDHWSKDKWHAADSTYTARATLLKRHGDAHCGFGRHRAEYAHLPENHLRGLLCLTDAVLLYVYGNFCSEQASGRVRTTPFTQAQQLRELVRKQWERALRGDYGNAPAPANDEEAETRKDIATAMVGLMHMVEAVIQYHLSTDYLANLQKRGKELAGPSPPSTNPTTGATPPTGPSPSSQSHSSSAESNIPPDLLAVIASTASRSNSATSHLLTSRHHLSMRLLRKRFPKTYDYAIYSPIADEALPAPGDNLGAARHVEIDKPQDFVWPIELGMCAPLAHTSAFGRCLVQEAAEALGMEWKLVLE